jgi:ABC-type multidrug transport system fused ATPase/permease subunit
MSLLDDLVDKVSMLNEAERVEYNRRLQSAKASKELASALAAEGQKLTALINRFSLISLTALTIFLTLFGAVFILAIDSAGRLIWLGSLLVLAVVVVLVEIQKTGLISKQALIEQQRALVEREWAAIGLEVSFLHAILEMEAAMHAKEAAFQNLQNISSAQAERKRTLSHYDYQIRNEILLNIQNEKNWWSKIDVLTNRWFNLN